MNYFMYYTPDISSNFKRGRGNGYVIIPKDHKYYGVPYDLIDVDIHGGITLSEYAKDCNMIPFECDDDSWVIGFDTAHAGDDKQSCPRSYVLSETKKLLKQLGISKE